MKKSKKDYKKVLIIAIILYSLTMFVGLSISYYTNQKGTIQFNIGSTPKTSNETRYMRFESDIGSRVFIDVDFNRSRGYIIADFVDRYNRTINNVTISNEDPSVEITLDATPWGVLITPMVSLDMNYTQISVEFTYFTRDPTLLLFMDLGLMALAFSSITLFFIAVYRYYQKSTSGGK